jgi:hypothetical protein
MKNMRLLLLSSLMLLTACPGPAAYRQQYPAEITGFPDDLPFPLNAAGYRRGKIFLYQPDKLNFSVAYDAFAPTFQNAATFFIYEEEADIELQFEREKQQISGVHRDATLLQELTTSFEKNGASHSGRVAQYRYSGVFAHRQQEVFSELILIKFPGRYVKVRSTAPLSQASLAQTNVRKLMETVDWAPRAPTTRSTGRASP